ncbi:MAG: OprO/OprP family phosphate-selective porin, partial [Draconibacterium sp.]|nr:OprO/OprP family phosphate-selective porin [Draconibacterium sp.]
RMKLNGFGLNPKLVYKMEFDVVNGDVLDAVIKWNFAGNFHLWFGQTKLPGNRERVISSQKLQFVDRSLLNSKFNIDRDKGIQLRHNFKIGNMIVREVAAVSIGEGKNYKEPSAGHEFTGRLELLPFGKFKSKGDYFGSDLKREEKPKLAMGITYDYNNKAVRSGGQLGNMLSEARNLSTVFADMMFKYRGFSVMTEYAIKSADKNIEGLSKGFKTGNGFVTQVGYLFKNNMELAARYTTIRSDNHFSDIKDEDEITIGFSKYIVGHALKIQTDLSRTISPIETKGKIRFRAQVEMQF